MANVSSKSRRSTGSLIFLLFFTTFWSGLVLFFDVVVTKSAFQQIQALSYPTTIGSITHSEVKTGQGDDGPVYSPDIRYVYSVGGKEFRGNRYRYGQIESGDGSARQIVASYPVGIRVVIHYDESDPFDAVLKAGLEGSDYFVLMFLLPFNLVMVGLWISLANGIRCRIWTPTAGGAKILEDGNFLRVRLAPWNPLSIGLAVSGGFAFLLTFVVGFGFGFNPPLVVQFAAWGVILTGGAIAYLCAHRKFVRGDFDLIIDDYHHSVVLPRTFGRKMDMVVPTQKILSFETECTGTLDSEGSIRHRYFPTIIYTDSDGSKRRERLVERWDESSAEGLVAWLSERLRVEPTPPKS